MIYLALGLGIVAILVWVGRQATDAARSLRIARAVGSALAATVAVVAGLRGAWPASLALVILSAWLGGTVRKPNTVLRTSEGMSDAQARSILGVGPNAGQNEIEAAYRRLMKRVHPDVGGAAGLAAQLNAARARLSKPS